jgi:signal transduction histidine kinase
MSSLRPNSLQAFYKERSIVQVRIVDDFEETLTELSKPPEDSNSSVFKFLISTKPIATNVELIVQPENLHVGFVEVVVDPVLAGRAFYRRTALLLIFGMANSLVLTIALSLLFYWIVTRRIERMAAPFRVTFDGESLEYDADELDALDQTLRDWRDQREAAAKEIAVAAERMQLATQVARLGIWELDAKDGALHWDAGMHAIYGTDPARFENDLECWAAQLHPDDRKASLGMFRKAMESEGTFNQIFRIVRVDGTIATLHGVAKTEFDGSGKPLKTTGVNIDMSEEEALRAELENMQRVEALGALSAGVAHDFNNVLAVIMGNLELASVASTPEEFQKSNSIALHACQQGKALTLQLLTFGRKSQLSPQISDVNQIIEKLTPMLLRTIPKSIEIKTSLSPDIPAILIDRALLETSLLNLVINARDAMTDGGEILFATSLVVIDPILSETQMRGLPVGRYVRVAVEDTGTGIAPEHLSRVFDPFFSTKKFGKGYGMGLSMVRGFAEQSGGLAQVYSEKALGTSIQLFFPEAGSADATKDPVALPASPVAVERKTILVVEDNAEVLRMTVLQLQHLGHSTIEAGNAQEALLVLSSGAQVNLVLTDDIMPGDLQGFDLARQLSETEGAPAVIMMSGYDGSSVLRKATIAPQFEILQKPVAIYDLELALARALG